MWTFNILIEYSNPVSTSILWNETVVTSTVKSEKWQRAVQRIDQNAEQEK